MIAVDWHDELERLRDWCAGNALTFAWIAIFNMVGWVVTVWACHH